MSIDYEALEFWSDMAAQTIQEIIDEAIDSDPVTPEKDICKDLRALLDDHNRIISGGQSLITKLAHTPGADKSLLDDL